MVTELNILFHSHALVALFRDLELSDFKVNFRLHSHISGKMHIAAMARQQNGTLFDSLTSTKRQQQSNSDVLWVQRWSKSTFTLIIALWFTQMLKS